MPNINSAIRQEVARIKRRIASVQESAQAEVSGLQARAEKLLVALAALGGSTAKRSRAAGSIERAKKGGNMERVSSALRAGALGVQDLVKKTGIAANNLHQTLLAMRRKKAVRRVRKGVYGLVGFKPKRTKGRPQAKRAASKAVRKTRKTGSRTARKARKQVQSAAPVQSAA